MTTQQQKRAYLLISTCFQTEILKKISRSRLSSKKSSFFIFYLKNHLMVSLSNVSTFKKECK